MDDMVKGLGSGARLAVTDRAFRTGEMATADVGPYVIDDVGLGREIDLGPLRAIVAHAMRRLKPDPSDAWLAPRVHATVRLTRREAADLRIWHYLAAVALPEYVRWRWRDAAVTGSPVAIDRFVGDAATGAISRLWWAAELTRDGSDYAPTTRVLSSPAFAWAWLELDYWQHRAAAQAAIVWLTTAESGTAAAAAVRAFDLALRTTVLESVAPAVPPDAEAVREWCDARVDETLMFDRLPAGPDESPADAADVAAVRALLEEVAGPPNQAPGRRRRARGRRPMKTTL